MISTTTRGRHWTGVAADSPWVTRAHDLAPLIGEGSLQRDRDGAFAHEAIERLRREGFLSMLVPAELGGGGASHAEACAVLATLAHGDPSVALTLSMHTHLVAAQVWRHRRDLPAPVLRRVADEQSMLISTGASDWLDSTGTATPVDGGFRVTARKSPASGCPAGDLLVTSARVSGGAGGDQVIHCAVPFAAAGVSIDETWDTLGMRATGSHTVVLDDVFVPESAVSLTRPAGEWHPVFDTIVGAALPLIMAVYVGVAETAAERAVALVAKRSDPDRAAPQVGRMLNRLRAAQDAVGAMVLLADDLAFDAVPELAAAVLSRRTTAGEAAIETVRIAIEATGGIGYTVEAGLERLFRDVHGCLFHPLPATRQEHFTGRVALGLLEPGS